MTAGQEPPGNGVIDGLSQGLGGGTIALLAAVVALAAFVQGTSGLGFALIVAPVVGMVDPGLLPVFLLASMIPLNLYVAWRERASLDVRGARWISAARLAATPGGLALLWAVPERHLGVAVGAATLLAALVSLLAPAFTPGRTAYAAPAPSRPSPRRRPASAARRWRWSTSTGRRPSCARRSPSASSSAKSPPWGCCSPPARAAPARRRPRCCSCRPSRSASGSAVSYTTGWTRRSCGSRSWPSRRCRVRC